MVQNYTAHFSEPSNLLSFKAISPKHKTHLFFFFDRSKEGFVCLIVCVCGGHGWEDRVLWKAGSCVLKGYKNGNHFYWQSTGIVLRQMET